MTDEKDLEIARLKGRLEEARSSNGPSAGKVLLWLIGLAVAGFVALVVWGSTLPEGVRFEQECRAVTASKEARETCMRDLEAIYIGPDEHRYRKNAADQWAADRARPAR